MGWGVGVRKGLNNRRKVSRVYVFVCLYVAIQSSGSCFFADSSLFTWYI